MAGNLKAAELRRLLAQGEFIVAPGIFDGMISARVADAGCSNALYVTGFGTVASHPGFVADAWHRHLHRHGRPGRRHDGRGGTTTPVIADADTGYGGLLERPPHRAGL